MSTINAVAGGRTSKAVRKPAKSGDNGGGSGVKGAGPTRETTSGSRSTSTSTRRTARAGSGSDQDSGSSPATFQAGTYNIAAGNREHGTPEKQKESARLVAEQAVSGEVDVLALQEVGVNGRNTSGRDNNEEILQEIFRQELPEGFEDADISQVSLNEDGQPVLDGEGQPVYDPEQYADTRYTATSEDGDTQNMTLTRDRYDNEGNPVDFDASPEDAPNVVYSAHLEDEDKTYNIVYSSNNESGSYGNAVLLRPGYEIEGFQQEVLGHDPDDDEPRSALAVGFRTPDGAHGTAISAHLTNGSSQSQGDARVEQLDALAEFANERDNVLILGDFNTEPGKAYGEELKHKLPFVDPSRTPDAEHFGLEDPDESSKSIDRLFTQNGQVTVGPRNDLEGEGGSDHDMVTWDVTLENFRQAWAA